MTAFVLEHTNFARWLLLTLLLGLPVVAAWTFNFRRLARTELPHRELAWEARRGLLGGAVWLGVLLCELLLLASTYEINVLEVVAASDAAGGAFQQSLENGRAIILGPAALVFGFAVGALLTAYLVSGAVRVRYAGGRRRG
jgi:hypothetical protein